MKKFFTFLVLMFMTIGVSLAQNVTLSFINSNNQCDTVNIELLQTNDSIVGKYLWTSSKISAEDSIVKAEILMTLDSIVNYINGNIANVNDRLTKHEQQIDSIFNCIDYLCVSDTNVAENSPPSIEITTPNNNAQILITTSTIASVTATDSDGTIDSVTFFIDDVRQSVDVSSPYTFNLPVNTAGNFEFKAIAYDNDSSSSSDSINYSVYENALPIVNITSPSDGDTLTIDTSFTASVTATDSDGSIDSVVFFINDVRQFVDISSPYTYDIPTNSSITRELKAIAYDNSLGTASDSLIYYINDTNTIDYDTIYINWTSFGASDVDSLPWNDADVNDLDVLPPVTILSNVYSVKGDTLGPLTRTSDTSSSQSWTATNVYTYAGWPAKVSERLVRTDDTMSFNLAGFEPNQEVTFRIFGGGASTVYADDQTVIIGDSVNLVTGLYQQGSNELSLAYGTADASGNLSFSICCPQGGSTWAYWKGMEIITGFVEGGTGPEPPTPPISSMSARIMDIDNIDLFTDDNLGWEVIYEGDSIYDNHYLMDGLAIFDQQDNDWNGTTFNGIKEDGIQRGLQLKFESSKRSMKFPWQMHYWLKQPIQIDSIGFFNNNTWGNEGEWNDIWFKISGATNFGDWTVLFDSIRGTNTDEMVWRAVNTADSIKYLQVIMDKVDRNGISASDATGNVTFTKKLSIAIIGDKAQPDTLPDLPENFWKTGLTYRERLSVNDLQDQNQDSLGTYFSGHRFYDNLSNFHLRSPGSKWVIEPNMFSSDVLNEVDARGDTIKRLKWYSSRYLSDRRNGGSNFNLITLQRGWKLPLTDDFSVEGDLPISKKTSYTYDVRDSGNYFTINRYTTSGLVDYDYRDTIFNAWHNTDLYVTRYDTALLSDLANKSDYLGDTTFKINALDYGFPFEDPLTWVKMGDPTKRDSIMTAPETWKHMAELFFAMSAIYGDVEVPKSHVDQYLEPGQLYRTGMGVLDAISKHQEPNKDWEGAQAHWKPQWVAMFLSVAYDGHLGTVCDTCGMFAADSSMYISYGGDMRLKGNHAIETWEWLMYFRNQVWDTLSSKVHPYSGNTMRLAPKIHMDTHHYFSTTGGQGSSSPDFLFPTVESTRAIEPEHPFFWEETEEFLKWANVNLPSDARIEMSEYGYGPNSGAPFSLNKDDIKITAYGTDWWPTAALSGGTGADSIDMGLDAYAVALEKRAEQLFWRHGWPHITKFQIRDGSYDAGRTLNGGNYQAATDSSYWTMNGNSVNQFSFMGVFKKSGGATRVSDQTYHWLNVAETMKDYELWEIETETDTVYSYIWRSTVDTTKYIKRVWRPTIVNDTTYNYTINFPESGTSDVVQINCYLHSFQPVIDSLGDITSYQTDIIEIEKMFGYTYVPVGGDTVSSVGGGSDSTFVEAEHMVLTPGISFRPPNANYSNDSVVIINGNNNTWYTTTHPVDQFSITIKSIQPDTRVGIYIDDVLTIDTAVGQHSDFTEYLFDFDPPIDSNSVIRFDATNRYYDFDYAIFYNNFLPAINQEFTIPENEDQDYLVGVLPDSVGTPLPTNSDLFTVSNDSLYANVSFDYEDTKRPNSFILSYINEFNSSDTINIRVNVGDLTDKYDENGLADADIAAKYPEVEVGDFILFNASTTNNNSVYFVDTPMGLSPGAHIKIHGKQWDDIQIFMSTDSGTSSNPIIVTNFLGQAEFTSLSLRDDVKNFKVTGKYDSINRTGHRNYQGHQDGYAYSSGKYGLYVHCAFDEGCGHGFILDDGVIKGVEIEFMEISTWGFSGMNIKWNNNWSLGGPIHIHDNYIHDIESEGIYLGSTSRDSIAAGGAQSLYEGVTIENNRILRTGGEPIQTGRIRDAIIRNNTTHGGLDWPSPFQNYQFGKWQFQFVGIGGVIENNFSISTTAGDSYDQIVDNVAYDDKPEVTFILDTIFYRNNLSWLQRRNLGGYAPNHTDSATLSWVWENNIYGPIQGDGMVEVDSTPETDVTVKSIVAVADNPNNGVYYVIRNNTIDTTFTNIDRDNNATTITGNTFARPPTPNMVSYMSGCDQVTIGNDFDFRNIIRYVDIICEDSQNGGPQVWDNCGKLKQWNPGEIVQWHNNQGETRFYVCIQFDNQTGNDPSQDDNNPDNAYWEMLTWNNGTSFLPPDDVRLVTDSYYDSLSIGINNIPQEVAEVIYDEAIINFTNFNADNAPYPVNNANTGSETGYIYPDVISDTWEYTSGDVMTEKLEVVYSPSQNNYATAAGKSINGFSGALVLRQWKVQVDSLHLRVTGLEPNTDYFFRLFASHGGYQGNNAEYRLNDQVVTLTDMVDKDEPIEVTVTSDANGYVDIVTRIAAGNPQGLIGGISFRKTGEYFLQPPTISNDFSAVEGRNVAIYENTINQKLFTLTGGTAPYTIRKDTLDGRWVYLDGNVMYNQNILDYESMYASHSVGGPMRILVNDAVGGEALFLVDALDATGIWDDNGVVGVSEADSLNSMLGFEKFNPGDYHALQSTNRDPDLELTPPALCDSCNIYLSGAWKNVALDFTNNDREGGNKMMVSNGIGQISFYERFTISGPRNVRISGAYDSINKLGDPNFNGEVWHEWKHQKFGIYRDIGQVGPESGNDYGFQFRVLGYKNSSNHHITTRAWKDVEIDHFEAIGGGAASIELKDDNIDSVFNVSGTYLHDFITQWPKGEGGYYGNTKPVWQEMTQNLVVKNAMYLQAGNEALQINKNTGTMLLSNLIASGAMGRYNNFQKFQDGIVNFGPAEPQGFQTITKSVFLGPGGLGAGVLMKPSSNLVQDGIDAGTIDPAATYTATANDTMQFTYNVFNKFAGGKFYMNNANNSDNTWAIVKFQDNYFPNEWNYNPDHLEEIQIGIGKLPNAVNFVDVWDMPIIFDRNNVPSFWTASVDGNSANDVIETNTTNQNSPKLHFNNPYGVDNLLPSVKTKIINAVGSVASLHVDSLHRHAQFTNAIFANVQNKENFIISNPDYRVDSLRVYKPHDVIIDFIPDISRKDGQARRQMMFYCIKEFKDSTDRPWKHPEAFVPLRWVNNEGNITHSPPNDYTLSDTSFYTQFDIGIINTSSSTNITYVGGDTSTTIAENTVWQKLGVLSGGVGDYRIDQEYGVGSWLRLRGDTVMNGVTFNHELQYDSSNPPGNPKFKIWDGNDNSQVFTIVVTDVTGAYDQNGLIPNQVHADSLNAMVGWNKFQVGDYHIVNTTNRNGGIYQLSLPNMGANKNIYISGFFTDVSFVFDNITGRDTSNQLVFSNGLGQFKFDGNFTNINPKGIRFTGKYDQSIRTGDTGYAATVHDTWKHGNFGIDRNARHSPTDAGNTFFGFQLKGYFSDIEMDHMEIYGGAYAGFDLKQDNPKNSTNTGDSIYVVHNLWVHDIYGHEIGELIYLGNTKSYPQHFFKNWKIYNILGVRTNYELWQVQRGLGEGHAHNFVGIGAGNWNDAFQISQGGLFQVTPAEPGNLIVEKAISSGGGQDFSILLKPYNNEMDKAISDGIINLADTLYSKNSDTVRFRDILIWRARHKGVIYANSKNVTDIRPDNYASFKAEKIFVSKHLNNWVEVDTTATQGYFWNYDNWMNNQDAIFDSIIMDTTILGITSKNFTDTSNIYRLNEVTEPEFENPWGVESLTPSVKSSLTTKFGQQSNWLGFTLDYIHRQSRWTTGVWDNAQNQARPPGYCTNCPIEYKVHDIISDPVVDANGQFGHGHYWRLFYCVQDHNSDTGDRPREDTDESHWIELGWVNDRGNYQPLPPDDYNTKVGTFYYNREMGLIEP